MEEGGWGTNQGKAVGPNLIMNILLSLAWNEL